MAKLIEELKKEHAVIVEGIEQIRESGISSKEGQQWLLNAKQSLLAHLKKEDDELYPVLNKAAEKDPSLKQTLEFFAKDMAGVSKTAIDFLINIQRGVQVSRLQQTLEDSSHPSKAGSTGKKISSTKSMRG